MANKTTNFGFELPLETEYYDINKYNETVTEIDNLLYIANENYEAATQAASQAVTASARASVSASAALSNSTSAVEAAGDAAESEAAAKSYYEKTLTLSISNVGSLLFSVNEDKNCLSITFDETGTGTLEDNISAYTVDFEEAADREIISSPASLGSLMGSIAKWLSDLKTAAFADITTDTTVTETGSVPDATITATHETQLGGLYFAYDETAQKWGYKTSADGDINPFRNPQGTATAADVLSGKTFDSAAGDNLEGTMENNGSWTSSPTTSGQVIIPAGYHDGSGYVDTSGVYDAGSSAGGSAYNKTFSIKLSGSGSNSSNTSVGSVTGEGSVEATIYFNPYSKAVSVSGTGWYQGGASVSSEGKWYYTNGSYSLTATVS